MRNGNYWLPEEPNFSFLFDKMREIQTRPRRPYVPREIADYNRWHTVLDDFCWLLKVTYTPPSDLKRKQFRLDVIFANYLRESIGEMERIASALGSKPTHDVAVTEDLRRGWYNEPCLSALRIHPLEVDCVRKMASESILHVVCVCINRIGTQRTCICYAVTGISDWPIV